MRLRVKKDGANVRLTASTANLLNRIGIAKGGTILEASELKDGWYNVILKVHESTVDVEPPIVNIPFDELPVIPFTSQWDAEANTAQSDCGPTCVKMLLASRSIHIPVNHLPFRADSTGYTNANHLVKNFTFSNVSARARNLTPGLNPPPGAICLVDYGGFNLTSVQDVNFARKHGWHWLIFLGAKDGVVWVHDPNFWDARRDEGAYKQYSEAEWRRAFIPYPGNVGTTIVEMLP